MCLRLAIFGPMTEANKEEIIRRLAARFGAGRDVTMPAANTILAPDEVDETASVEGPLRTLVFVAASRKDASTDRQQKAGFSASDLAPALAKMIDHTALKAETHPDDIHALCDEALQFGFASVCVNPCYVPDVAERLDGSGVVVCTVIGFPLGANRSSIKAREAELAVADGASEVDMVLNVGMLKSAQYEFVESDIRAVVSASISGRRTAITKVILETALLTDEEKVIACALARRAGANFVKTSTGFSRSGATASDVALMRRAVGSTMGVKASGGIRSTEDAMTMIAHGADRIGASASVSIVKGLETASWS